MQLCNITAISPLDGRYSNKLTELRPILSEFGLIQARVKVEIKWLIFLSKQQSIIEIDTFSNKQIDFLENIYKNFSLEDANKIKNIEKETNHDVKAVEYFIKNKLAEKNEFKNYLSFIHFACTSEDINNLAYSIILKKSQEEILLPNINIINNLLISKAKSYQNSIMLARTHGQSASPTTMGKELIIFADRINKAIDIFTSTKIYGKINGAVGNYNAHKVAYPNINWLELSKLFVKSLNLEFTQYTTQINPHDDVADYCQNLIKINNILLDLVQDIWSYISFGYFSQEINKNEVGSSTMPHKVNPIDFENAEGNIGLANSLLSYFSNKLPISRLQRDLSDSTVLRNLGCAFGYSTVAYCSIEKGLNKLLLNETVLKSEVNNHWEVLAEAVQTVMRKYGIDNAYEQLKELTRGSELNQTLLHEFINAQPIADKIKQDLKNLTPDKYIGFASELVNNY